jgi:hypothetical protein
MTDPEKRQLEDLKKAAKEAETKVYVALKDDSAHPPASIGKPPWQNILFGSMLGQPSSRLESFDHAPSNFRAIARLIMALAMIAGFFLLLNAIFS